jgi:hypothetical protein
VIEKVRRAADDVAHGTAQEARARFTQTNRRGGEGHVHSETPASILHRPMRRLDYTTVLDATQCGQQFRSGGSPLLAEHPSTEICPLKSAENSVGVIW